jgi:prepilin-type N-terminal cleavage/methylation domain-containing protein
VNRGFTLVEILISLVLMLVLAAVGIRLFLGQHWTGLAQSETAAVQGALRSGALFLTSELRELGGTPGDPDLLAFSPDSLTYRAMRGAGTSCDRTQNSILLESATFSGYRAISAGRDSILLHLEGRIDQASDDRWLHLPILSVSGSSCGGAPAILIGTVLDTILFPRAAFASLAPARTFEVMQAKLYQSGGDFWLGARSVSAGETIQPLAGPLASNGLELSYLDSTGTVTTQAENIRSIGITLRALSSIPIRASGGSGPPVRRADSLVTLVALRNW